ncbi:hypothetical protein WH91_10270 [Devosia psychrophila]|uniref:Uncharacterized protein n=1 Tax=Devosia psychrophila TaxID=728005 RepID=A0ABR5DYM7_9HYPH|nr:hypothetical protein WH91_10270 [Devosia psychrophila]
MEFGFGFVICFKTNLKCKFTDRTINVPVAKTLEKNFFSDDKGFFCYIYPPGPKAPLDPVEPQQLNATTKQGWEALFIQLTNDAANVAGLCCCSLTARILAIFGYCHMARTFDVADKKPLNTSKNTFAHLNSDLNQTVSFSL